MSRQTCKPSVAYFTLCRAWAVFRGCQHLSVFDCHWGNSWTWTTSNRNTSLKFTSSLINKLDLIKISMTCRSFMMKLAWQALVKHSWSRLDALVQVYTSLTSWLIKPASSCKWGIISQTESCHKF